MGVDRRLKVAVLTGRRAYPAVEREASRVSEKHGEGVEVRVFVLPVDVVSFLDTGRVLLLVKANKALEEALRDFDMVLVPGTVSGSTEVIERELGVPVFKASSELSMLCEVVTRILQGKELSKVAPAEELMREEVHEVLRRRLKDAWISTPKAFELGGLPVPPRGPPFLLAAEIPPGLNVEEAVERGLRLEEEGVDIVVVGGDGEPSEAFIEKVSKLQRKLGRPILGVDASSPWLVKEAVRMGTELVLTLTPSNAEELEEVKGQAAFVAALPTQPEEPEEVAKAYEEFVKRLEERGFQRVIVDPLFGTPSEGLLRTALKYRAVAQRVGPRPMFACLGNYTELVDADPHGVEVVLAMLMAELGVSVVMTTSESWKTRESAAETRVALHMAAVSWLTGSNPRGLGVDLLLHRGKRPSFFSLPPGSELVTLAQPEEEARIDRWGYVTVHVDNVRERIVVCMHKYGERERPLCYEGKSAKQIYKRVLKDFPEFSLEHAAYLGYELSKAELSLATGRSYVQDAPLFVSPRDVARMLPLPGWDAPG